MVKRKVSYMISDDEISERLGATGRLSVGRLLRAFFGGNLNSRPPELIRPMDFFFWHPNMPKMPNPYPLINTNVYLEK